MGPYGPGGIEVALSLIIYTRVYLITFSPLSWGLGQAIVEEGRVKVVQWQIGPIKIAVQTANWIGDRVN